MTQTTPILIQAGTLVTHETMFEADILLADGVIQAIGKALPAPAGAEIIDVTGKLVLPGVIDPHVHFQLDTGIYKAPDDWAAGSRSAAFGGVTTVVDFATQFAGMSFAEALQQRLAEAAPSVIDYALHMMVTDVAPGEEDRLGELVDLGVQSIKLYTTYRPNYYADDATVLRLLQAAATYGLITLVHCENDAIVTAATQALVDAGQTSLAYHGMARPAVAEVEATQRMLFLAEQAGAPVVIAHNSLPETMELVVQARQQGQAAFCETGVHYLLLDESLYAGSEPWRYILQPPLRSPAARQGLWDWVQAGDADMLMTDHCGYAKAQKMETMDFTKTPGGLPGVETSLPLMVTYGVMTGRIGWPDLVRMMAYNPAWIYNLLPHKGLLQPGADADLVIYDPGGNRLLLADDLHTDVGYSPFETMEVTGHVDHTLRRGEFLVRDGVYCAEPGSGKYLPREPLYLD